MTKAGRGMSHTNRHLRRLPTTRRPLLLVAAMCAAATAALVSEQPGGPTVSWTPTEALEFVVPDMQQTATVRFRSSVSLTDVRVVLTPELEAVVSAAPARFPSLHAGQEYSLVLTLRASSPSQRKLDGTLRLTASGVPSRTFARPLPMTVIIHQEPVPPDPGEAGLQTLEGIDGDGDGVRDDVQRWIVLHHLEDLSLQAALNALARTEQAMLLGHSDDATNVLALNHSRRLANGCLDYLRGIESARGLSQSLRAEFLNTRDRTRAYLEADSKLSGTIFHLLDDSLFPGVCVP